LEEVSFNCLEYSNEFELKGQQMRRKSKTKTKQNKQDATERTLRRRGCGTD